MALQTGQRQRALRVKICGITRVADAIAARDAGADAIGLVFFAESPRYISLDTAISLAAAVRPFVTTVGLFVNPDRQWVESVLASGAIDLLQFHGDESPGFCDSFHRPYIKAIRVGPQTDVLAEAKRFPGAAALLLDTWRADKYGGTGEKFDWRLIPRQLRDRLILAGGLTPDNVAAAVAGVAPMGVDVSGGVEKEPGIKDAEKITGFIKNARSTIEH